MGAGCLRQDFSRVRTTDISRRRALLGGLSLLTLSGCSGVGFNMPSFGGPTPPPANLPSAQGQTFGSGPVRVALLLPLVATPT